MKKFIPNREVIHQKWMDDSSQTYSYEEFTELVDKEEKSKYLLRAALLRGLLNSMKKGQFIELYNMNGRTRILDRGEFIGEDLGLL